MICGNYKIIRHPCLILLCILPPLSSVLTSLSTHQWVLLPVFSFSSLHPLYPAMSSLVLLLSSGFSVSGLPYSVSSSSIHFPIHFMQVRSHLFLKPLYTSHTGLGRFELDITQKLPFCDLVFILPKIITEAAQGGKQSVVLPICNAHELQQ